ncbi:hypothetical protein B0A69_06985 [Chryseobacterium shigense]|uniref:Por secretion system C-terminal sorting domain-containing protein n=1 Tax=Chryseobacterium shigense TaxID=297244 RepID=A0A1N7I5I6_9FLAO|nr:T9SS type A sorting domain-containing protein [Chryseobacterium shigense]PQA95182.1 hypothetical protein B0A69_06985 [Chryseobacterium shigense]SIS32308.1 Por secretion system C-terminal sorting domain-containing protein [Chryseobacterium shigense]
MFTPNGTALVSNAGEGKLKKKLLDGSYDPNFGINGSIPVSPTSGNKMDCVANDQNIYTFWRLPSPSIGWTIKKYDSNGVLDSSYGVNGTLTINYNYYQVFTDNNSNLYFVDLNNKIKKILANGQVDNSFNFNNPTSIVGLSNNYLYIYRSLGLSRLDFNGNLDTTFGNQGGLYLEKFYLNENTDEIITFTISNTSNSTMIIEKYTSTGIIDTNFGVNGVKTITAFTTPMFYTADFDSDGNIVFFGGYSLNNWTIGSYPNLKMIMRLKPNGMEDYTFNHNSFYYMGNTDNDGYIIDAKIVNGNKYLVINKYRYTMGSFKTYLSQIIRTAVLSTSEIDKEGKLSVYPNPVQDEFNIVLQNNEKLESVEIFDMAGRSILKTLVLKNNVADLTKGTYLLLIKTNKKSYQTKFIKN